MLATDSYRQSNEADRHLIAVRRAGSAFGQARPPGPPSASRLGIRTSKAIGAAQCDPFDTRGSSGSARGAVGGIVLVGSAGASFLVESQDLELDGDIDVSHEHMTRNV